ncbi:MAG: hypothetical protein OXN21_07430 [Chloroflexota bacterium]|nr:hypothetical protein [Chloroflexota bacterium]
MDLTFERGNAQRPKGHALVYFRVDTEPDKLYASYIVVLPVKADFGKYVPPFLASHLGNMPLNDFSAFAMPPVPEEISGHSELERLSELRDDDLVFASSMFSFDLPRMMEGITDAVQSYSDLCSEYFERQGLASAAPPEALDSAEPAAVAEAQAEDDNSYSVNEVLLSLMSERDKLAELSRLLGKLQFAQEGRDDNMTGEVTDEITALSRHLPEEFQVLNLLAAASEATSQGSRLAQLYLDRCFRLSDGDTASAQTLENQIQDLREGS